MKSQIKETYGDVEEAVGESRVYEPAFEVAVVWPYDAEGLGVGAPGLGKR